MSGGELAGPSRPRQRREREREAARATILAAALDLARSHVVRLWATAHGLVALLGVGRLEPDAANLHALLDDVLRGVPPPPGEDPP